MSPRMKLHRFIQTAIQLLRKPLLLTRTLGIYELFPFLMQFIGQLGM